MNLNHVKMQRGMDFLKKGMKVQFTYNGEFGVITGGNSSGNINVKFDGKKYSENCHPKYMMKYFDNNNNVIAEFKE